MHNFFIDSHISLETGPPTRTQPKPQDDGWRKITLTVPNDKTADDIEIKIDGAPVAPPRRKRSSVALAADRQLCGFKELFGNNVSRRSSCDSILKDDNPLTDKEQEMLQQKRKSKSISDFNLNEMRAMNDSFSHTNPRIPVTRTLSLMERSIVVKTAPIIRPVLQRKISKVGNKKSDKFFGENLSDCLSDEPITPDPDTHNSLDFHTSDGHDSILAALASASSGKDKLDMFIDANVNNNNNVTINANQNARKMNEIDSSTKQMDDKKSSLDKKAEFLMAMLDDDSLFRESKPVATPRRSHSKKKSFDGEPVSTEVDAIEKKVTVATTNAESHSKENGGDEEYYKGMTPVEEPIIVPRRRSIKHICDDDEHIRAHLRHDHKHSSSDEENKWPKTKQIHINGIEAEIIAVEKPKADSSGVEKAPTPLLENQNGKSKPRVRHLSQENLMSNKILLSARTKDTLELLRMKQKADRDRANKEKKFEPTLKKCESQQSFLTQELMNQLADRVFQFQDPFDVHNEDQFDDGSSKCAPKSTTTRKISVHRKESTIIPPIKENLHEEQHAPIEISKNNATRSISASNSTEVSEQRQIPAESKEITQDFLQIERNNSEVIDQKTREVGKETTASHTVDCTDKVQTKSIKKLEKIINEEDPNDEIIDHVLKDICKINGTILDDFQKYLNETIASEQNKIVIALPEKLVENANESVNDSSDEDNTVSDVTVKELVSDEKSEHLPIQDELENHLLASVKEVTNGERRDSIVEVDQWFLKHNDLSIMPRRGSESNTGYDTRKVFPFGKPDEFAGSKFFESKTLSKSADNVSNDSTSDDKIGGERALNNTVASDKPDETDPNKENRDGAEHSILLKYLK